MGYRHSKEALVAFCKMVMTLYMLPKKQVEKSRQAIMLFMADIIIQGCAEKVNVFPYLKTFMNRGVFDTEVLRKFLAFLQTELKKQKDPEVASGGRQFQAFLEKECNIKIDEYIQEAEEGEEEGGETEEESEIDLGKIVIK